MNTLKTIILASILLVTSCAPQSKEAYLLDYKGFILKVEKEHESYTDRDWNTADIKSNVFTGKMYSKFEKDLTWQEEILVKKYQIQYSFYKTKNDTEVFFENPDDNEEYQKLKEQLQYYIDNDMQKDVDELLKQAKEISDSTVVLINEIIEELEKKHKEQSNSH